TNFIGTTDAVDFIAKTNNQERLRISSSGNVGIGTTSPAAKLDVLGGVNITSATGNNTLYIIGGNTPTNPRLYVEKGALEVQSNEPVGTNSIFSISQARNQKVTVLANGNVGVETSTPNLQASLDLSAPDKALLTNRVANTSVITSPAEGMIVYVKDEKCFKGYANSLWRDITPCSGGTPIVTQLNCGGGALNGSFTSGTSSNGTFSLPYAGGNGVAYIGQTILSTGVTGLTATLNAGTLANGSGSLTYTISGTPSSSGTANFTVNFGGQSCTFNVNVSSSQPQVILLNCGGGALNGSFTSGTSINGTFNLPYAGGNGVAYIGQTILSTGVTGLTATLNAGTLANGSGSLTYTISGTPSSSGTANFTVNFGGQSCTFNVNVGAAKCGAYIAPGQWKDFMCHNLGADVSADPFTPSASIQGAKYQWGAT
ncbi:hypothetical protein SAMN05880574_1631, partial [Chryseobacterium sp. RU37D]